jgi:membrane protein implicated in regulation of membrane protease activity
MHLHLIALAWMFVVVLMALAEGTSSQGSWLGAFFTLLLYGVMPLAILLYVLGTPGRKRSLREREAQEAALGAQPHGGGHPAGDAVAPERKEP